MRRYKDLMTVCTIRMALDSIDIAATSGGGVADPSRPPAAALRGPAQLREALDA